MKLKEVGFSESIQLSDGHWIKAWASVEGDNGDDPNEMWKEAKKQVMIHLSDRVFQHRLNSGEIVINTGAGIIQTDKTNAEADADTCTHIYSCTELKVLESYKFIVRGKPELQQAYDEMYLKLSKGENQ